jgi:hypothetical protein
METDFLNNKSSCDKLIVSETLKSRNEMHVLLALADAVGYTLDAHVPKHAIFSKFKKDKRGWVEKELKVLARRGFAGRHPTKGETTWNLSREGLRICKWLSKR